MKNRIVSLILVIPLVLLFCVFSASNIVSLSVPIAVSSVSIFHDEQEIVNLAQVDEFQINAQVYPKNATNKGLIYSYEVINKGVMPESTFLEINENGLVKAKGCGTAKISVTTKDGAYKKSFILEVVSTKATDLIVNLDKTDDIFVGDEFNILATVLPQEALDKNVKFESNNNNVLTVDEVSGECKAISSGVATITATLENSLQGRMQKVVDVVVLPQVSKSLISLGGKQNLQKSTFNHNYSTIMEVNYSDAFSLGKELAQEDIILDYDSSSADEVLLTLEENNNGIYKFKLTINGIKTSLFNLKASLNYGEAKNYSSEINLKKLQNVNELDVSLTEIGEYLKLSSQKMFKVSVNPEDFESYSINASTTDNNISVNKIGNLYYIKANSLGSADLIIKITVDGQVVKTITKNIAVVNPPTSINFSKSSNTYGIENLFAVASEKIVNNTYQVQNHVFEFTTQVEDINNIEYSTSDCSIAEFQNNELVIKKDGEITIFAKYKYAEAMGLNISCSLDIRCVNGVNVSTYNELVKATEDGKQVVLTNDIMLGEKLIEINEDGTTTLLKSEAECAEILESEVHKMKTTGEWNFYKYCSEYLYQEAPEINYIIKFTNNCYGNGFVLNANNITNLIDGTDSPYSFAEFKGPLDLVSVFGASVKAQDNICFIASDNVVIDNVELVGANLNGNEGTSLSQLNCSGTVLEVMGDNVKVVNSRVRNGRNCIRVYGKEYGNQEKINVLIESCIISNAREFLIKMGTNKKLYGDFKNKSTVDISNKASLTNQDWEDCSPKINGYESLNKIMSETEYNNLVALYKNDSAYQDLIMTNLTVKNCVLHTSGLFAIGLESSFAGPALDGGIYAGFLDFEAFGWVDIAGTSYPTQLNLEGDVKIYDWKKLSNVDSSVLIEGDILNFDISAMVKNLAENGHEDILSVIDDEEYAHGGIVMYGGGKNYCLVNTENLTTEQFNNYRVSFSEMNTGLSSLLEIAAGRESFRLFMYGNNSNSSYLKQVSDMQDGSAYVVEKCEF